MNDIFTNIPEKCGILPPRSYARHARVYKIISGLHALFLFVFTLYPSVGFARDLIDNEYDGPFKIYMIFIAILYVGYSTISAAPVYYCSVKHADDYVMMKKYFRIVDTLLKKYSLQITHSWLYVKFAAFMIVFILFNIASYLIYTTDSSVIYNLIALWPTFVSHVAVAIAWKIYEDLRKRLRALNGLISHLYDAPPGLLADAGVPVIKVHQHHTHQLHKQVYDLIQIYEKLYRIARIFNKMFGAFILYLMIVFIVEIVSVMFRMSVWSSSVNIMSLYMDLLYCVMHLLQWLVFVVKSQQMLNEGEYTIDKCYKISNLGMQFNDGSSSKAREQIAHLTLYTTARSMRFTAAKFYEVNYNAIFIIFNMLASYVVVVIQFSSNMHAQSFQFGDIV